MTDFVYRYRIMLDETNSTITIDTSDNLAISIDDGFIIIKDSVGSVLFCAPPGAWNWVSRDNMSPEVTK